jgi:hypothetical protein
MYASPRIKRASAERRMTELATRRRELRATPLTWRNRKAVRDELEQIELTINWLLDNYDGQR